MADDIDIEVKNLKEFQDLMTRLAAEMEPQSKAGTVIQFITLRLHRYMTGITHVISRRLGNSLFPELSNSVLEGRIITNVVYAPVEEARGGTHAFMERTAREDGAAAVESAFRLFEMNVRDTWDSMP